MEGSDLGGAELLGDVTITLSQAFFQLLILSIGVLVVFLLISLGFNLYLYKKISQKKIN